MSGRSSFGPEGESLSGPSYFIASIARRAAANFAPRHAARAATT